MVNADSAAWNHCEDGKEGWQGGTLGKNVEGDGKEGQQGGKVKRDGKEIS